MNLDGSKRTQLTHGGLNKFLPHFSPDGTRVLLYRLCSGDEAHSGVTLTDKTGSYRTWITNGFGADWNPVAKSGCCMPTSHSALDSQSSWSPIAFASLPLLGFDISRKTKYEEIRKSGKRGIPKEEKQARRALMGRLKWICQERSRSARITYIGNVAESQRGLWASVSIVYSPYGFFSPVSL